MGRISWTSYPLGYGYQGMATHCSILAGRILPTEVPWRVTVHGVTNSLARLCTKHTVSFDIIGNLLCQMQCPYIIILSHQEKPYSKEIRPRVSRRRKHGVRGLGTTDWKVASREPVWGGGVNLGGGASAFICITNTHRTQYVQFIIRIYRNFLQT